MTETPPLDFPQDHPWTTPPHLCFPHSHSPFQGSIPALLQP